MDRRIGRLTAAWTNPTVRDRQRPPRLPHCTAACMTSSTDFLTVAAIVGLVVACSFRTPLMLFALLAAFALRLIRWLIVVSLIFGLVNCPQASDALGVTPLSLLIGEGIYVRSRVTSPRTSRRSVPVSRRE